MKRLLLTLFLIMVSLAFPVKAEVIDKIVATVNGEAITLSELERILKPVYQQGMQAYKGEELNRYQAAARRQLLEQLIENKLIMQQAKEEGLSISEAVMEEELADIKEKFGSFDEFEEALEKEGMTIERFKKDLTDQLTVRAMMEREIVHKAKVSPEEIKVYYSEHKEEFLKPEMVRIGHILISDNEEQAKDVYRKLEEGAEFSELARQYSEAGDPGLIPIDQLKPKLKEIVESLHIWEYSPIIKTEMGWHIIQLKEQQSPEIIPLSGAWDSLETFLFKQKMAQEHKKWVNNLKYKSHVIIEEEL